MSGSKYSFEMEHTRHLKINYLTKIKGYHSYNNETCILYNIFDYSSNVTKPLELDETENRTLGEPKYEGRKR